MQCSLFCSFEVQDGKNGSEEQSLVNRIQLKDWC